MTVITYLLGLLQSGLGGLAAYLAAHVLLCLLPAFFIAGALSSLLPKEAITRYLGRDTSKWISYPAAAAGGFLLAVCSCTIMPLFASIYKKGAGLGPAVTFLFVGPAVNILAISFTGVQIGLDIALARVILSIVFGIVIGLLMSWIFRKDDTEHVQGVNGGGAFNAKASIPTRTIVFFVLLLGMLIAGTLQVGLLQNVFFQFTLPGGWAGALQGWLDRLIPPDAAMGIEGVSVQGLFLIGLLVLIGLSALKGFRHLDKGLSNWTTLTLGLTTFTLIFASLSVTITDSGVLMGLTGRWVSELIFLGALWWVAAKVLSRAEIQEWLWETWRFVKQIIPLLLIGVFVASIARGLIPCSWIQAIAGSNTFWANLAGVLFGVFMYFPTLVEVPVAQTFLSLGMHRGPLLAYLLADPELSLQSILITNTVIGKKKTAVYVTLVTVFSTVSGLLFGWIIR